MNHYINIKTQIMFDEYFQENQIFASMYPEILNLLMLW